MLRPAGIQVELSERVRGLGFGGLGAMHTLAHKVGLIDEIDRSLHVLKIHLLTTNRNGAARPRARAGERELSSLLRSLVGPRRSRCPLELTRELFLDRVERARETAPESRMGMHPCEPFERSGERRLEVIAERAVVALRRAQLLVQRLEHVAVDAPERCESGGGAVGAVRKALVLGNESPQEA
jgi:hypothetical protein